MKRPNRSRGAVSAAAALLLAGCAEQEPECTEILFPSEDGHGPVVLSIGEGCVTADGLPAPAPVTTRIRAGLRGDLGYLHDLDEESEAILTHYRGTDAVSYLVVDHSDGPIWLNAVFSDGLAARSHRLSLDRYYGVAVEEPQLEVTDGSFTLIATNYVFEPTFDESQSSYGPEQQITFWFEVP